MPQIEMTVGSKMMAELTLAGTGMVDVVNDLGEDGVDRQSVQIGGARSAALEMVEAMTRSDQLIEIAVRVETNGVVIEMAIGVRGIESEMETVLREIGIGANVVGERMVEVLVEEKRWAQGEERFQYQVIRLCSRGRDGEKPGAVIRGPEVERIEAIGDGTSSEKAAVIVERGGRPRSHQLTVIASGGVRR